MPASVSVLLPAHDAEATVTDAVEDILAQTFDDIEVIAIDDGSSDGTEARLHELARRDGRVRVLGQTRRGIARALERGLTAAEAPLIARMDADDRCPAHRLERLIAQLTEAPETDLVSSQVEMFPAHLVQQGMADFLTWQNGLLTHEQMADEALTGAVLSHGAMLARKTTLLRAGGYRDVAWAEDEDLFVRLLRSGATFAKVGEVLYRWREGPTRTTRVDARLSHGRLRMMRAWFLKRGPLAGVGRVQLWSAGRLGSAWTSLLARHGIEARLTELRPRSLRRPRGGAAQVDPSRLPSEEGQEPLLVAYQSPRARSIVREALELSGRRARRDFFLIA